MYPDFFLFGWDIKAYAVFTVLACVVVVTGTYLFATKKRLPKRPVTISLAAMIVMVVLKHREIASGRPSFISRAGRGSDHVFQLSFAYTRRGLSYLNRRTFVALVQLIAFHVLKAVRYVYVEVKHQFISNPQGKKLIDAVRGKGEVSDHGASFYLRRIAAESTKK